MSAIIQMAFFPIFKWISFSISSFAIIEDMASGLLGPQNSWGGKSCFPTRKGSFWGKERRILLKKVMPNWESIVDTSLYYIPRHSCSRGRSRICSLYNLSGIHNKMAISAHAQALHTDFNLITQKVNFLNYPLKYCGPQILIHQLLG